jgi:NAD(P)-dependent dehydrogenase (short-subunit alcohol dehydrogenase family)
MRQVDEIVWGVVNDPRANPVDSPDLLNLLLSVTGDDGEQLPLRPLGRPASEEVSNAALFLGSAEASYVNGAVLAVDGGRTAV